MNRLLPAECRSSAGPDRAAKSYKPPPGERPLGSGMPKQNGTSGRGTSQGGTGRGSVGEQAGVSSSAGAGAFWAAFGDEPLASTAPVAATQSAHTLGGAGILREDSRAAGSVPGGFGGAHPRASAPAAAGAGASENGQGPLRRNASDLQMGREDAESRHGEAAAKGSASVSASGGAGGSNGSERGAETGVSKAGGATRADELKAQIERLQGQLKRLITEREELKASNTRLSSLVETQAAEIAELKARLEASGAPGPSGDPWAAFRAPSTGRRFTESDANEPGASKAVGSASGFDDFGSLDTPFRGSQGAAAASGAGDPFHSLTNGLGSTEPLGTGNGSGSHSKVQPNGWQTFAAPQASSNQPAGWAAF